jgi:hypothetical protein
VAVLRCHVCELISKCRPKPRSCKLTQMMVPTFEILSLQSVWLPFSWYPSALHYIYGVLHSSSRGRPGRGGRKGLWQSAITYIRCGKTLSNYFKTHDIIVQISRCMKDGLNDRTVRARRCAWVVGHLDRKQKMIGLYYYYFIIVTPRFRSVEYCMISSAVQGYLQGSYPIER